MEYYCTWDKRGFRFVTPNYILITYFLLILLQLPEFSTPIKLISFLLPKYVVFIPAWGLFYVLLTRTVPFPALWPSNYCAPMQSCSCSPFPWALQPTQGFSSSLLTEPKSLTFIVSADFIFWYMALFSWIISYLINKTLSHLKMSPPYKSTLKLWLSLNWTRQK